MDKSIAPPFFDSQCILGKVVYYNEFEGTRLEGMLKKTWCDCVREITKTFGLF